MNETVNREKEEVLRKFSGINYYQQLTTLTPDPIETMN